jgi:hypothetical protein
MIPIAHYLIAAALSNFMNAEKWQKWADKRIDSTDKPEAWLCDVSLANDIDSLRNAIEPKLEIEKKLLKVTLISDAIIGYYYKMYEIGRITIEELLRMAGAEADGGQSELECEDIYSVLNIFEENCIINHKIEKDLNRLFESCKILAMQQWEEIEKY